MRRGTSGFLSLVRNPKLLGVVWCFINDYECLGVNTPVLLIYCRHLSLRGILWLFSPLGVDAEGPNDPLQICVALCLPVSVSFPIQQ